MSLEQLLEAIGRLEVGAVYRLSQEVPLRKSWRDTWAGRGDQRFRELLQERIDQRVSGTFDMTVDADTYDLLIRRTEGVGR